MDNYQEMIELQINKLITSLEDKSFESFKTILLDKVKNVQIKESINDNLVIISNSYTKNTSLLNDLERECKSLIMDKETLEIISYTYDDIFYNQDAKDYILKNGIKNYNIQECFEGTLLSFYYYNNKWNVSTRSCLDARDSYWASNKSYYDLFLDAVGISFNEFTNHLKPEYNYYFVLVHYENKNIVDYTNYFNNPNYKEIVHVLTRDRITHNDIDLKDNFQWNVHPNFKTPKRFFQNENNVKNLMIYLNNEDTLTINHPDSFADFQYLDNINKQLKLNLPVECEGFIVKIKEEKSRKTIILKFQTNSYQFMSVLKPNNNNIYMSFIELYQNDFLKKHLEYFPGNSKLYIDDINESYDTIGVVDASFKVITSELFEIFRYCYDLKDCSHKNKSFYLLLPTEYTVALYKIRGIYYKKKEKYIKSKQNENINENIPQYSYSLKIFDIYNMLKKKYEIKDLLKLFRARKLLVSKYQYENVGVSRVFNHLSDKCDKVSIKMFAILLNKMFPNEYELNTYSKFNAKSVYKNRNNNEPSKSI